MTPIEDSTESILSGAERRALRARAHALKPVVRVAAEGLSPGVLAEIERALGAHELIKIHAATNDREERQTLLASICEQTNAHPVQIIGKVLVAYRARPEGSEDIAARPFARRRGPRKTKRSFQGSS
jgi:RNA-binding protein